jgi:hypothetical protein
MSTTTSRRIAPTVATALAALAVTVPAASARPITDPPGGNYPQATPAPKIGDTPADYPGASRAPVVPTPKSGDTPSDYPGTPGARAQSELADTAPTRGPDAGGFDWASAGVGAAAVGGVLLIALGGFSAAHHARMRAAR